jgi:O-antigen/teichoic acid export membrane protein
MGDLIVNRISRNVFYNGISFAVTFIVNFALLPFIISHVGKEIFGIYTLVMVVTGYFSLGDLGITSALVKFVAEFKGRLEYDKINGMISSSFSILMILGVGVALALLIVSYFFEALFRVEEMNRLMVKQLFWVAAGASLFIWPGKSLEAALQGFQSYGWLAVNNIISTLGIGISALYLFTHGFPITYYLAAYYFFTILRYISAYFLIYSLLLTDRLKLFYYPKQFMRQLFGFGSYVFLGSILNVVILQFDNILIGAYLSVAAVSIYAVVYNLQNLFRGINGLIGGPLVPLCAEMEGQGSYDRQKVLLFKGTKYMTLFFVSMVVITILFSGPIIRNWMGEQFTDSILPAQILLIFWIFNGPIGVGGGILLSKGLVRVPFIINLVNAICNLTLSVILIRYYGIVGVVLGTTIPMVVINFPLYLHYILKKTGVTMREYFQNAIKRSLLICFIGAALAILIQAVHFPTQLWVVAMEMSLAYGLTLLAGYKWILSRGEKEDFHAIIRTFAGR